jgi:hypothetical protein
MFGLFFDPEGGGNILLWKDFNRLHSIISQKIELLIG